MEERFTTEEMGKMVLEQAKGEKLKKYMDERFSIWFINVQDSFVEIFVDDNELSYDAYDMHDSEGAIDAEELYDYNFYVHDELLKSLGIDIEGEEVSWVMEHSNIEFYPLSEACELNELALEMHEKRFSSGVYSEDLKEILDELANDLINP